MICSAIFFCMQYLEFYCYLHFKFYSFNSGKLIFKAILVIEDDHHYPMHVKQK